MTTPTDPLDALIASYVQAIEAGQIPNRKALLDRNPDLADALQTFFGDFDRMDRVAAPLRLADETTPVDESGQVARPTVRYFGDYELLEEVARGGMGIVYKARQTSLNRLVALKMILAGTFASPRDVARFQAEAEAAANLDHPQIVPVYEVGEHDGQQYFSMKFIEGHSLAAHPRATPRDEVAALTPVILAVHHAHQHGVLHRDLKPSNVLVDSLGLRFVTDFGLAKRLADVDRSLTEPGQVLGTPRYMAPEQAAGRKDLTVAADIYSLGVILYERLTGQTPFLGDNVLTLLRQVRESIPPRPSSIRPGLDRDLETVVLKCLEKDPTRRYLTAADLAADLTRWHQGRPIAARPVGQAEKFARWCRRNPAVASLAASVALALIVGTVVSTLIALKERTQRLRAELAEQTAVSANDATERIFARSLVRPLNPNADEKSSENVPLSEPEMATLWDLASQSSESVRFRFLDEALRDPFALRQLWSRSEPALIAAVGLDPSRRALASRQLVEVLGHTDLPLASRTEIAFLLLNLDHRPSPLSEDPSAIIVQALAGELPPSLRASRGNHLISIADSQDPGVVASLLGEAIVGETDADTVNTLALALSKVATRLDKVEATRLCRQAARTMAAAIVRETNTTVREIDVDAVYWLASALGNVSARLDATEAARSCGQAARSLIAEILIVGETNERIVNSLVHAFDEIFTWLDAAEAASIARSLTDGIDRKTNTYIRFKLAWALGDVVTRLDAAEAARFCGQAAPALATAIERATDFQTCSRLELAMDHVSPWLDAPAAATIARALAKAIQRETNPEVAFTLAFTLKHVAPRLDAAEATTVARTLADAIQGVINPQALASLLSALVWMAPRLDAAELATVAHSLTDAIRLEANSEVRDSLVSLLGDVAPRLDAAEAAKIARTLADAIQREPNPEALISLEDALGDVAPRLDAAEAAKIARTLADAIQQETLHEPRNTSASALGGLAPRLDAAEAASIARTLVDSIQRKTSFEARYSLESALRDVAPRLDAAEAASIAHTLADTIQRKTSPEARYSLESALRDVAPRLDAAAATTILHILTDLIQRETNFQAGTSLIEALGNVAAQLDVAETARFDQILIAAIERETKSSARIDLARARAQMPVTIEPDREVKFALRMILALWPEYASGFAQKSLSERYDGWESVIMHDQLEPGPGRLVARELAAIIIERWSSSGDGKALFLVLSDCTRKQQIDRAHQLAAMILGYGISGVSMLREAKPYPCRLTTEDLVELLKMPTCFGEARRVVLNQLGNIHGRRFANHWEFVRFAEEKGLKLDFTSPPRRPNPKAALKRMLDELPPGP